MARLPLLDKTDVAAEFHDIFGVGMNLHRVTLHSPQLARHSRQTGLYLRNKSRLDARLRELAILQAVCALGSRYEYSHHLKIALEVGVAEEDIRAVAARNIPPLLDPLTRAVLAASREMALGLEASDATFDALRGLSHEEIIDLLFSISYYCGFARFTNSLRIEVEPEYQAYLDRFPLPDKIELK